MPEHTDSPFEGLPVATADQLSVYLGTQQLEPVEHEFGGVLTDRLARRAGIPPAGYLLVVSILTRDCIDGRASLGHRLPEILCKLDAATYRSVGRTAIDTWGMEAFGEEFAAYMRIAARPAD